MGGDYIKVFAINLRQKFDELCHTFRRRGFIENDGYWGRLDSAWHNSFSEENGYPDINFFSSLIKSIYGEEEKGTEGIKINPSVPLITAIIENPVSAFESELAFTKFFSQAMIIMGSRHFRCYVSY